MNYPDAMELLSQCGIGAALIDGSTTIHSINDEGDRLLQGGGKLAGKRLLELAPQLCGEDEEPVYANTAFGEYLKKCPTPSQVATPAGTRLVVFRAAVSDACHDMLISVVNHISESVILCDSESRIYLLNDAAVKMDSMVTQDVLGDKMDEVYRPLDGKPLTIPEAIQSRRAKLNYRQYYATRYGKHVDIVCNTFPIVQNGQVLGAFSVMEDTSTIDDLNKQIIELRDKLTEATAAGKNRTRSALTARYQFSDIIHVSPAMRDVVEKCRQVAKSDSSVMIYGETGTGKELFAQSIHNASRRADGPFLAINCAAIPENLLESMLFGTEKGAYTGAERRTGLFEQANSGTLLLDEINSMNINLQSKLLRVLQEGSVRRVGGSSEIPVDVRVLSNINIPPDQAIAEEKLRRDLFYRLGVVNINIPPLRERREDIPLLAKSFVMQCNEKLERSVRNVDAQTLRQFDAYSWPGNVRELQHAIEHAMNILPDDMSMITSEYIPELILERISAEEVGRETQQPQEAARMESPLSTAIQDMEREAICKVLRENGGNISKSARILQISRQNLQYRIKRYKIDMDELLRDARVSDDLSKK